MLHNPTELRQRPVPQEPASEPPLKTCRICFGGVEDEPELGKLISPCKCKGTMKYVHLGIPFDAF
jgi:E3 ubiquitin-protein ligase DOA10